MGDQGALPYPYEFKEVSEEEKKEVTSLYNNSYGGTNLIRVGPKGYIVHKGFKRDAANIYNMPLRDSDVFVASYQRSGTTWTQELIWLLANDLDYTKAEKIPISHRYPFLDFFMFFDEEMAAGMAAGMVETYSSQDDKIDIEKATAILKVFAEPATQTLATTPSPRFIKTHLPMSLLPPKVLNTAKVVYVARDPRDVAVSCYHHAQLLRFFGLDCTFKAFWNIFHKSLYDLTPYFEHVKEAWEQRHNPNMLFLFYEELSKDLPAAITRAADFLGKKLNDEQMTRLCHHLSIEQFKKNKSVNYEHIREVGLLAPKEKFIRKGKAGGWRDYFDEEMTQQAEKWIADNLRDTDLRFPHM